jgi:hypothetical protein
MMRLLGKENFPGEAVESLRKQGHDVASVRIARLPAPRR